MLQSILLSGQHDALYTIMVISAIVILSYLFNILAKRTNIPSVLMLIVLGAIIGLIMEPLGLGSIRNFEDGEFLETIGLIGLTMIVLEAALDLELSRKKWPTIWKSFTVALLCLVLSAFLVGAVIYAFGVKDMFVALLYAIPLSIMSSAIIIPSVGSLIDDKKEFMVYESAFSDILGIMFFFFLKDGADAESAGAVIGNVLLNITVTLVSALVASYILIILFQRLTSQIKLFLLIAVLLILFAAGKLAGLSSLVIILVFGLALNNREVFFRGRLKKYIDEKRMEKIEHDLHVVTFESSFLVRTFFFVAFGVQIEFSSLADPVLAIEALFILAALYGVRWLILRLIVRKNFITELFIAPRGLITILLFFYLTYYTGQERYGFDKGILLYVIIISAVIMTWGLIRDGKKLAHVDPEIDSEMDHDVDELFDLNQADDILEDDNQLENDALKVLSGAVPTSVEETAAVAEKDVDEPKTATEVPEVAASEELAVEDESVDENEESDSSSASNEEEDPKDIA